MGIQLPGEAFDVGAANLERGRERAWHQVVNPFRSSAYARGSARTIRRGQAIRVGGGGLEGIRGQWTGIAVVIGGV